MSGSVSQLQNFNLANLTAPASGTTHAAKFLITASAGNPATITMSGYVQQIGDFLGQAMTVDNSANAVAITIAETTFGWARTVQAGALQTFQYPAVTNQIFIISASANVSVGLTIFDWPAFPEWASLSGTGSQPVSIVGPVSVTQGASPWVTQRQNARIIGTDRGGTITVGGTSKTLAAVNLARNALVIANPSTAAAQGIATAESLFVNLTAAATLTGANFAEIVPGGRLSLGIEGVVDTSLVTIIGATTAHRYYAMEW